MIFLSTFRNESRKLVGAEGPASLKAHLFVRFTVSNCPVGYVSGVLRLAAQILKRHGRGHKRLFGRLPRLGIGVCKNEALVLHDFEVYPVVWIFLALGAAHDDEVGATWPDVQFGEGRGPGSRREPLSEEFGISPCLEHLFAWR